MVDIMVTQCTNELCIDEELEFFHQLTLIQLILCRNFVIATKELLKKWLLNSHILDWVGSNLLNLNSISPKIVLHFIDRNLLHPSLFFQWKP